MMNVNWTNEQIFKLIDMFQEKEFLWNIMLTEYKDRNRKHEAWCEIANAFGLDKQAVERKMKSLIGQFQRELRKTKGCGADEGSKWFAYKRLMFLKGRGKSGRTADTEFERDEMVIFEVEEEPDNEEPLQYPQLQPVTEQPNLVLSSASTQPRSSNNTLKQRSIFKPPTEEKRRHREPAFTETTTQFVPSADFASFLDDSQAYGNYLTSKLRQYSRQTRNALQHEISQLLFQADNGYFQTARYGYTSSRRSNRISTRSPSMDEVIDPLPQKYERGNSPHILFEMSSNETIKNEVLHDSD